MTTGLVWPNFESIVLSASITPWRGVTVDADSLPGPTPPTLNIILLENGDALLLESNDFILLE